MGKIIGIIENLRKRFLFCSNFLKYQEMFISGTKFYEKLLNVIIHIFFYSFSH